MNRPSLIRAARLALFGGLLLASAAIREGPSSAVNQAIIWLPTGVAIAGLCLLGLRAWWVIALTTLVQRFLLGYEWGVAVPAAGGSTAEAVLGVLVLRRLGFRASLARLRDIAALVAAAGIAPLGSIFFSWIGRSFVWNNPTMPFYSGWDGWWRMNALGAITVVPIALTWLTLSRRELTPRLWLGVGATLVIVPLVIVAAITFAPPGITGVMVLNTVLVPMVLYASGRFGMRGATLAGTLSALVVAVASSHGYGPFIDLPREQRHVALQLFELTFVSIPPAFGAVVAERRAALDQGLRSDELRRAIQAALPDITYRIRRDGLCLGVSVPPGEVHTFSPRETVGRSVFALLEPGQAEALRRTIEDAITRRGPATVEYEVTEHGRRRVREARCVPHGEGEVLAVVRDITDRTWSEGTMAFEARVLGLVAAGRPPAEVFAVIVEGMEHLSPGSRCSVMVLEGRRMHVAMGPSLPDEFNAGVEGVEIGPGVGSCGAAAALGRTIVVRDIATDALWDAYRHMALPHGLRSCWSVPIREPDGVVLGTFAVYHGEPRQPDPRELALAERAAALAGIALDRANRGDALRRSEDLLASINRNVQEGLFRTTAELHVRYANLALARLFGFDAPEDMIDWKLGAAVLDRERLQVLDGAMRSHGQWLNEEVEFRRRDGTAFWGLLSGTAVRDAEGAISHYDGAVADITARKELEEQFRQSQKMEAVGKLAGGVAHDFNNLLTVIVGYADAIRTEAGGMPSIGEHAEQVLDAATRASGLTRQLLAYSRQQVLSPKVLELNAVVDRMGGMLRRLIGEHIRLVTEHRSGPCWVRVDPSQIEQVLLNLAVNARDAMVDGGTLTIETERVDVAGPQTPRGMLLPPGPFVQLSFRDSGVGMSPEVQARAFDPFFTTKEPGRGTGLGLSTVHGIVHQSGGSVWLESSPGAGTTVRIALPYSAVPSEAEPPSVHAVAGPREGTVLIVEDEPGLRSLVSRMLQREGYRVHEAADGEMGLWVARDLAGAIDLVVTDVVMPRMSGREMASRMLASWPDMRFLFMSGYPDDARTPNDLGGAAGAFMSKPFAPDQLIERVGEMIHAGT